MGHILRLSPRLLAVHLAPSRPHNEMLKRGTYTRLLILLTLHHWLPDPIYISLLGVVLARFLACFLSSELGGSGSTSSEAS